MAWIRFFAIVNGLLVGLLVLASLFGDQGVIHHEKLEQELRRVHTLNGEFTAENKRLAQEVEALKTNEDYVKHVIRDDLGWIARDEVIFLLPPEDEKKD